MRSPMLCHDDPFNGRIMCHLVQQYEGEILREEIEVFLPTAGEINEVLVVGG